MKGSTATTLGAVELPMNKSQTRIQPSAHESDLVVVITSSSTKTQLGHRRHLGARGSGSSRDWIPVETDLSPTWYAYELPTATRLVGSLTADLACDRTGPGLRWP